MGFRRDARIFLGGPLAETKKTHLSPEDAAGLADEIASQIEPMTEYLLITGALRRQSREVGDIELLALPTDLDEFLHVLETMSFSGGKRSMKKLVQAMPITVHIAHKPAELGAMTLATTGDRLFFQDLKKRAAKRGWALDQYGIWDSKSLRPILQTAHENDFFVALGLDWVEPEDRLGRGE